jgi:hypothetical protein
MVGQIEANPAQPTKVDYNIPPSHPVPILTGALRSPSLCCPDLNAIGDKVRLFVVGADNAVYTTLNENGIWLGWEKLGGIITSTPACTSTGSGYVHMCGRGSDGAMWWMYSTDSGFTWTPWHSAGGILYGGTSPSVSNWGSGRVDWFVTGTNTHCYHKASTNPANWEDISGLLTSSPAAVAWDHNRIDIVGKGTDNHVWHKSWNGSSWSGWDNLGGLELVNTSPAIASAGYRQLDVFAIGTDSALWTKHWQEGWSAWKSLGGICKSTPAACYYGDGLIVAVIGSDNNIWFRSTENNVLKPWASIDNVQFEPSYEWIS